MELHLRRVCVSAALDAVRVPLLRQAICRRYPHYTVRSPEGANRAVQLVAEPLDVVERVQHHHAVCAQPVVHGTLQRTAACMGKDAVSTAQHDTASTA